jgi:hypothetical protein
MSGTQRRGGGAGGERRGLFSLAVADAYAALTVTHDDERREAKATAALDHLGDAVNVLQGAAGRSYYHPSGDR